jgi:hypothetical protein
MVLNPGDGAGEQVSSQPTVGPRVPGDGSDDGFVWIGYMDIEQVSSSG